MTDPTGHKSGTGGLLFKSKTAVPGYYKEKTKIESMLGKKLTNEDFEKDYYQHDPTGHKSGTSVFDPVLCELIYRWFVPVGGTILDPFSGGSVRGIVASVLGRDYVGVDLRAEQVEANREQAREICKDHIPVWHIGDSTKIDKIAKGVEADFVFSCPPYLDLEVYSEDPNDLSNMSFEEFIEAYRVIIKKSVDMLKDDRFACFVVGEVRDKEGNYYNFVGETIKAFMDAGLKYYNEAILVTQVGSLPVRVGRQFDNGRKLGKTHQNVLVFLKGDARKATEAIGTVEFGDIVNKEDYRDDETAN